MTEHPLYRTWAGIKNRCYNKKDKDFNIYGKRGIIVCERWRNSFAAFVADMGDRPSKLYSIDRINTNGNYEPSNCRWATIHEQNRNRRGRKLTPDKANEIKQRFANGERNRHLAKEYGICSAMVTHIVKNRNWTDQ